jgi:uncharacterized membrane protein
MNETTQLVLPNQQFWVLLIGALVPLAGYAINKAMPWNSEQVKGIVQVVLAAIGGTAYTVIFGDVHGIGDFVQQCVTAIIAGLFTHKTLWAPAGINLKFGANPPVAEVK